MSKANIILTIPEPGKMELVEKPYPKIKSGYLIVKNEIAPVCLEGSRIWAKHDFEFHDDPEHLGHESVGTVVEVNPGSNFKPGERVIVFQGDYCGQCHSCRNGLSPTYCQSNNPDIHGAEKSAMKGIEFRNESESGGFAMATYRIAPEANLYRIPDEVSFKHAAACNLVHVDLTFITVLFRVISSLELSPRIRRPSRRIPRCGVARSPGRG